MGIARTWRGLKAMGQAANEAAARNSPGSAAPPHGFAAAFTNVAADLVAAQIGAWADRRGEPLPGTDAAVADGLAWAQPVAVGADALRARDAAFDLALLESFAGQVFAAISAVWRGADAGSVRPVLADALWEPLAAATGARANTNRPGAYGQGMLQATARAAGLHAGSWYDSALVIMNVSIDLAGLPPPPPGTPPQMLAWDEDWLFQRSVRPGGDPMIRPPACPSCGAPTRVDETGRCTHCHAEVPFLTTGWLASGIASRNPFYALMRDKMAEQLRTESESAGPMSPEMMRLLPPGVAPDGSVEDTRPGWAS